MNKISLNLPSADELFKSNEMREEEKLERIREIPLENLHPFPNHPFKVTDNEELRELAKSIAENGILTPAIVRERADGTFEIVSGHRRKLACMIAGKATLPAVVCTLDDDAATIIMIESNQQRENLLPSEKAFGYKMKLEAMKRQGKRTDLTSPQLAAKFRADDEIAKSTDISGDTIRRFIRLTNLTPTLLDMVDTKRVAFSPSVELSYLPKKAQDKLCEIMELQNCTPSLSQAVRLKKLHAEDKLTDTAIFDIMQEKKANQQDKITFRIDKIAQFFPRGSTPAQIERAILALLEERKRKLEKSRNDAR